MRLLLLAFLLIGCNSRPQTLQFNLGNEAVQLDWNRSFDSTSAVLLDNIMEGLTTFAGSIDGVGANLLRPTPGLAFSWTISNAGRVYLFHLRPNVFWSDGVELEAQHFVDSWQRLLSPATRSANANQLFEIENAAAFAEAKISDFSKVGVRAVDRHTLEVRLRRPVPYFLHLVASASTFPIRKDLISRYGDQWTDPEHLVTLGPYRIGQWNQGEQIVLRAYASYYGTHPKIDTVICRLIAEPLTAYAYFENGNLDIIPHEIPSSFARALQSHVDYRSGPKLAVSYLLFNVRRAPFDRVEARRAFVRAMNRSELTAFFEGAQTPYATWIPPGLVGHETSLGLSAEGEPSGEMAGKSLSIAFSGTDTWNLVFQSIQRRIQKNLQVKTKLESLDSREFAKLLAQLSGPGRPVARSIPHMLLLGWIADYPDPHSFMSIFQSSNENNYMRWKSARYDQLVEEAVASTDEAHRRGLYLEAQRILLEEEVVLMPLYLNSHQALVRSNLRGVHLNVLDKWYFKNIEFADEGWGRLGGGMLRSLRSLRGAAPGSS